MPDSPDRKWKTLRDDLDSPSEKEIEETSASRESDMNQGAELRERMESPEALQEGTTEGEEVPDEEAREESVESPVQPVPERVLVVQSVAATTRLIRETLENFSAAEVVTTSNPLRGFELALQKEYRLFLFGMELGELSGPMLYELISKTYSSGWAPARLAPGVVFIRDPEDPRLAEELERDVRVKDVIQKPVRIDRLLRAIQPSIEVLDPTSRP